MTLKAKALVCMNRSIQCRSEELTVSCQFILANLEYGVHFWALQFQKKKSDKNRTTKTVKGLETNPSEEWLTYLGMFSLHKPT